MAALNDISAEDITMTALVTGASSGIGLAFSNRLAELGFNVILVSNQMPQLSEVRDNFAAKYPQQKFIAIFKDLSHPDAANELYDYCTEAGIVVDVLVNNAGIFNFKEFTNMTQDRLNLFIDLHMRVVTQLCYLFGNDMKRRRSGYILNMSSMSCWMPMPGIGIYAATKAYIRVLSRSIALEMKDYGVSVMVACPGGISTELFGLSPKLRKLGVALGVLATPESFTKKALNRLFKHKVQYINGLLNRFSIVFISCLPTKIVLICKHKLLDKNVTR